MDQKSIIQYCKYVLSAVSGLSCSHQLGYKNPTNISPFCRSLCTLSSPVCVLLSVADSKTKRRTRLGVAALSPMWPMALVRDPAWSGRAVEFGVGRRGGIACKEIGVRRKLCWVLVVCCGRRGIGKLDGFGSDVWMMWLGLEAAWHLDVCAGIWGIGGRVNVGFWGKEAVVEAGR